jgi:hypothetical protein
LAISALIKLTQEFSVPLKGNGDIHFSQNQTILAKKVHFDQNKSLYQPKKRLFRKKTSITTFNGPETAACLKNFLFILPTGMWIMLLERM